MAIVENFPYSNQHNLNLDWMISKLNEYAGEQIVNIEVETIDASHFRFKFTYASGGTFYTDPISMVGGPQGPSGTITVGTVTTVDPTDPATVTNSGTNTNAIFDFEIPKGATGATGATGPQGQAGGITDIDGYIGPVTTSDGIDFDTSTGIMKSYDFNLTDITTIDANDLTSTDSEITSISTGSITIALNATKTIGKIYGSFEVALGTISAYKRAFINTGISIPAPSATYNIDVGIWAQAVSAFNIPCQEFISIGANGEIILKMDLTVPRSNTTYKFMLPACIYFFKDFGDNP